LDYFTTLLLFLYPVVDIRNKSQLPMTPIVSSMLRLTRYHLGTVAKGSFIITLVEIPRLILTYIHNQLKGKVCTLSHSAISNVYFSHAPNTMGVYH
jgi:hypothetical protein